jgi:hydantoinase/carbamoylase family amidase
VRNLCSQLGKDETVATVGQLTVRPGAVNIVPGEVAFSLEIRDLDNELINLIERNITQEAHKIAKENDVELKTNLISQMSPVTMNNTIIETITEVVSRKDIPVMKMPSGAAHDAQSLALVAPAGMIFVPSRKGISHSPDEFTDKEELTFGVSVLLDTLNSLDARL